MQEFLDTVDSARRYSKQLRSGLLNSKQLDTIKDKIETVYINSHSQFEDAMKKLRKAFEIAARSGNRNQPCREDMDAKDVNITPRCRSLIFMIQGLQKTYSEFMELPV